MRGRVASELKGHLMLGGLRDYIGKYQQHRPHHHPGLRHKLACRLGGRVHLLRSSAAYPWRWSTPPSSATATPSSAEGDLVIAISQSGETADTLAAIELAKSKGATIFGVCNVVGSSIARASHAGAYTHAGPEIGVASTKAFTAQITVLTLMAILIAQRRGTITEQLFRACS